MSSVEVFVASTRPASRPRRCSRTPASSAPCSRTPPRSRGPRRRGRRRRVAGRMRASRFVDCLGGQAAALDRRLVVPADRRQARVERLAASRRSSVTGMPALAHAMAMPPPIVPAPMIATRSIGAARGPSARRAASWPRARRRTRGSAPWPARVLHALEEQLALAAAAFVERQRAPPPRSRRPP